MPPTAKKRRADYAPLVRPRAMRDAGQRKLTPNYPDPGEVKTLYIAKAFGNPTSVPQTMLTPTVGRRIRLIRLTFFFYTTDATNPGTLEVYFGTGATILSAPTKAIDNLKSATASSTSTRTWGRGEGPRGARNEVLTARWPGATDQTQHLLIEYTEER